MPPSRRDDLIEAAMQVFYRQGFHTTNLDEVLREAGISRMTFVVEGGEGIVEQVEKQLYKLIDVVKVTDLTKESAVVRELALIKVRCRPAQRREQPRRPPL